MTDRWPGFRTPPPNIDTKARRLRKDTAAEQVFLSRRQGWKPFVAGISDVYANVDILEGLRQASLDFGSLFQPFVD